MHRFCPHVLLGVFVANPQKRHLVARASMGRHACHYEVSRQAFIGILVSTWLTLFAGIAWAISVEQIPTPRPAGWVTDQTSTLRPATVAMLNEVGDRVFAHERAELAVVLVPSLSGENPRSFATELFNHWGIGDSERDNGVLIFVAVEDRKAELILGDGVDEAHQLRASDAIMQHVIVPNFKRGDPDTALLDAARAVAADILAVPGMISPLERRTPSQRVSGSGGIPWKKILYSVLGLGATSMGARFAWRRRPRDCQKCGNKMVRLGEQADDAYLSPEEQLEENLGSVDYDVWACRVCQNVIQLRYGAIFSRYSTCPKCGRETASEATRTIRAATTLAGGVVEVTERCANCAYRNVYQRFTPRLEEFDSSSNSGFGGGSSSGSGSSGSW